MSATITAGAGTTTTSPAFTITAAGASQLVVTTQPSASTVAGVAFAQQPVGSVQDAFGNLAPTDADWPLVVAESLTTGSGTVSGTLMKTAVAGVADFSGNNLSIFFFNDTATTEIYTLSLHDALPISTSPAFTITAAAASQLVVTIQPSASTVAGVAFAQQPV